MERNGTELDAVVVGAGFSGLYMLHRLRALGLRVKVLEEAADVGGTWYWNRYPGARCDIPTTDYTYTFDPDLERDWTWSEKYATQPEILAYLGFFADRYELRRDIEFGTRVADATWDPGTDRWRVRTDRGEELACRFFIMATGCLSRPKTPDIAGTDRFGGEVYFTSRWPHQPLDFTGKRVAVIGTGSSGIQCIPLIAAQAAQLTVFQRTPNFSIPAHNGPPSSQRLAALAANREGYRDAAKWSRAGVPMELTDITGAAASEEVRRDRFEAAWELGELIPILSVFADQLFDVQSNQLVAEMIREKIRSIVKDPETAEALCPRDHPLGTKRPCLDTRYFETFNLPHVRLIDLRRHPITTITDTGIDTDEESLPFDAIVYATGFDAMTGPIVAVDITGRDGLSLRDKWRDGPSTYLGLTATGFPNFFAITGPGSPSVLSNMTVSIEQHVEWVAGCISYLTDHGFHTIEATATAEEGWNQHAADCGAITLYPRANSWYMGSNVPGKPRVIYPYTGGVEGYRRACDEVVERGYLGFRLAGPDASQCNDGVVRRLQPDVMVVLDVMASLGLPPLDTLPVAEARGMMQAAWATRPPGPAVGEIVDAALPTPAGDLPYRLYRPVEPGPHPVIVYFHGGGWVLGDLDSDDPLCRDICDRSGAVVVSVNYRHAPEHRFPAAADDGFEALQWVATHAAELGGIPGQVAVAGWSAGANLAAVACQRARDEDGPQVRAQLLLTPVTDCSLDRPSFVENADGYVLTTAMMRWFWDNYAEPEMRSDPKASPLRGSLADLPPAVVVTAEFDPLRDDGGAYAQALSAEGVTVEHIQARGHTHTSLTMVDVVLSGAPVRTQMMEAFGKVFGAAVSA